MMMESFVLFYFNSLFETRQCETDDGCVASVSVAPNPPLCSSAAAAVPCEPIIGWRAGKSWRKFGRFVLTTTRVSHVF